MFPVRASKSAVLVACSLVALACAPPSGPRPRVSTVASLGSDSALETLIRGIELRRAEAERRFERQRRERAAAAATVPAPGHGECGGTIVGRHRRRAADSAGTEAVITASIRAAWPALTWGGEGSVRVAGVTLIEHSMHLGVSRMRVRLSQRRDSVVVGAVRIGFGAQRLPLTLEPGDSVVVSFELCELPMRLNQIVTTGTYGSKEVILDSPSSIATANLTNVQHREVDEGGIVKRVGDYLVVLRRGMLHSVRVADSALQPVASRSASPPGATKGGAWVDELLAFGNQLLVIGYSYAERASEVSRFRLRDDGEFEWMETQHFSSQDYYSFRNYASRLLGDELILYTPMPQLGAEIDPRRTLPQRRQWAPDREHKWMPAVRGADIYAAPEVLRLPEQSALHVVTRCSLRTEPMRCRSMAVMGGGAEVFYVSPRRIYLWTAAYGVPKSADSLGVLYRLPLDGDAPSAVRVRGIPIDQLSFQEDSAGTLHVLTDPAPAGGVMFAAARERRTLSLLRLAEGDFGDGTTAASPSAYRALIPAWASEVTARFVRNRLVIGLHYRWNAMVPMVASKLHIVPLDGGAMTQVRLTHAVERVDRMGARAIAIGAGKGGLHFSAIELDGTPRLGYVARLTDAAQGETRSHAFFYREDEPGRGMVGLPLNGGRRSPFRQLFLPSARVGFLRDHGDRLEAVGALHSGDPNKRPPECANSCLDWYGNSRPLFFDGRILALIGDEIVEGAERDGRVTETRRVRLARAPLTR